MKKVSCSMTLKLLTEHHLEFLLNSLRKSDKMLSKPRILSLFLNSFNKFNKNEHSCKILYVYLALD